MATFISVVGLQFIFLMFFTTSLKNGVVGFACEYERESCGKYGCYTPEIEDCIDDKIICPKGEVNCSSGTGDSKSHVCYDPGVQFCEKTVYKPVTCFKHEKVCYHRCYSPKSQDCFPPDKTKYGTEYYQICYKGYVPSSQGCKSTVAAKDGDDDDESNCPKGKEECGNTCFMSSVQTCHPATLSPEANTAKNLPRPCYKGLEPCGKTYCMDSEFQECATHKGYSQPCPKTHSLCGSNCYNSSVSACLLRPGTNSSYVVCRQNQQLCGYKCYNTTTKHCIADQDDPLDTLVCPIGFERCNTMCYNSETHGCTWVTSGRFENFTTPIVTLLSSGPVSKSTQPMRPSTTKLATSGFSSTYSTANTASTRPATLSVTSSTVMGVTSTAAPGGSLPLTSTTTDRRSSNLMETTMASTMQMQSNLTSGTVMGMAPTTSQGQSERPLASTTTDRMTSNLMETTVASTMQMQATITSGAMTMRMSESSTRATGFTTTSPARTATTALLTSTAASK